MIESCDIVVIGAGPAGLRAAEFLAEAGREVLVLEKNDEVGPKTCAGGLTWKSVRELRALGLPATAGLPLPAHVSFRGEPLTPLDPDHLLVRTLARRALGEWQLQRARGGGAEVRTGTPASRIDLAGRSLLAGGRTLRYQHLIGADGANSAVRRALAIPAPRAFFAGEYNVTGIRLERLFAACDSAALAGGYYWVFPHEDYTSFGAMVHKTTVPPALVRPYLGKRLAGLGIDVSETPFEGASIETSFAGVEFPNSVYLAGEAAGLVSALTGEGIYGALISGEEVARGILEPGCPRPKLRAWLNSKRTQDAVSRLWLSPHLRALSFAILPPLCRWGRARHWLSELLMRA
jgi:geranylgeranyl reductase